MEVNIKKFFFLMNLFYLYETTLFLIYYLNVLLIYLLLFLTDKFLFF